MPESSSSPSSSSSSPSSRIAGTSMVYKYSRVKSINLKLLYLCSTELFLQTGWMHGCYLSDSIMTSWSGKYWLSGLSFTLLYSWYIMWQIMIFIGGRSCVFSHYYYVVFTWIPCMISITFPKMDDGVFKSFNQLIHCVDFSF